MTTSLYPIKFRPISKEKVWGEEIWKLSGLSGDETLTSNGFLTENSVNELIEVYLGDLIGEKIYEKFGEEFPLLIKYLNIDAKLSLQIHPDDETAMERHGSYGKTECWYIIDAKPTAKIYLGLNRELTSQELFDRCNNDTIEECMNVIIPKRGDIIPIVPGTLHSATGGVVVAEIQQTSDVTYRVYDWGRERDPETARETHLDLAIDCINYQRVYPSGIIRKDCFECPYFRVNVIELNSKRERKSVSTYTANTYHIGASPIYICVSGCATIALRENTDIIGAGEIILIPANYGEFVITGDSILIEVIPLA